MEDFTYKNTKCSCRKWNEYGGTKSTLPGNGTVE